MLSSLLSAGVGPVRRCGAAEPLGSGAWLLKATPRLLKSGAIDGPDPSREHAAASADVIVQVDQPQAAGPQLQ